ncbi:MAG: KamA family radical SAM protein [Candidatus Omnitrophica bacterium]|nr:KamA family radical SAM protein [Candidatus Omnitrophota bacterium]
MKTQKQNENFLNRSSVSNACGACASADPIDDEPPSGQGTCHQVYDDTFQFKIPPHTVTNIETLSKYIPMAPEEKESLKKVNDIFRIGITPHYFSLISDVKDMKDPIRMQCVPDVREIDFDEAEFMDPLGEEKSSICSCLVHRYPNRALLIVTSKCFMYCRHCTRKRIWKDGMYKTPMSEIEKAVEYIKKTESIREVIVSGGDPFTLTTSELNTILKKLSVIKHLKVIRIGTRTPVVFPERINGELCVMLEQFDNIWVNVQFNHPREITPESEEACRKLQKCGIPMNNQAVLLKGINDNPAVMKELCEKLMEIRVRPYYLFQCDPVVGTSHFRTSVYAGVNIIEKMRGHTSGMAIPVFVVDGIDAKGKIPVSPNYVVSQSEDSIILRNYKFETFEYKNPK